MNIFEQGFETVAKEINEKLGRKLDLENETYVLQTPSAYITIGMEDDDNGEKTLAVHVTGGQLTYLETDNDIFNALYGNEDE